MSLCPHDAYADVCQFCAHEGAMRLKRERETRRVQPCLRGNDWCPVGCCDHLFKQCICGIAAMADVPCKVRP
jgi:hypothetical protein